MICRPVLKWNNPISCLLDVLNCQICFRPLKLISFASESQSNTIFHSHFRAKSKKLQKLCNDKVILKFPKRLFRFHHFPYIRLRVNVNLVVGGSDTNSKCVRPCVRTIQCTKNFLLSHRIISHSMWFGICVCVWNWIPTSTLCKIAGAFSEDLTPEYVKYIWEPFFVNFMWMYFLLGKTRARSKVPKLDGVAMIVYSTNIAPSALINNKAKASLVVLVSRHHQSMAIKIIITGCYGW